MSSRFGFGDLFECTSSICCERSYSLAFVGDGPWLGTLDRLLLIGMTMESVNPAAKTIPEALFMLYQMTFAIITVALVAGSVADRMRFSAYLLFSVSLCLCGKPH